MCSSDLPVKERRKLSVVGLVAVSIVLSKRGEILADPEIAVDGLPEKTAEGASLEDVVLDAVDGTLASIPPARRRDPELVREAVRRATRAAVDAVWGKKPIVKVFVAAVEGK